jgi:hypothetical protein
MCEKCCCPYMVPPWWVTMGAAAPQFGATPTPLPPAAPAAPSAPTHTSTPPPPPPPPPVQTTQQPSSGGNSSNGLGGVVSGLLNTVAGPIGGLLSLL